MSNKKRKNILILFAPAFLEFGCDLVKSLLRINSDIKVTALCMGGNRTVNYVNKNLLPQTFIEVIDYELEERKWLLSKNVDLDYLSSYEKYFGHNYLNKLIIADRRLGKSFVRGGLVRPSRLADLSIKHSGDLQLKYNEGAIRFQEVLFKKNKYDLIFLYAVAGAPAVLLSLFAKFKNIELRRFQHTRIQNRVHLDKSYQGGLQIIREKFLDDKIQPSPEGLKKAKNHLDSFRRKPTLPDYSGFNNKIRKQPLKKLITYVIYFFAYQLKFFLPKSIRGTITNDKLRHKRFYFFRSLISRFASYNFDEFDPNSNYIYFPLHRDPEASTMVLSPFHTNQLSVIESLAKNLPPSFNLVVKEHIPMFGFRPKGFYKKIQSFPKVKLIHPEFDQFSIIKSANIISVITGTAGLEGILLKKKILLFEKETPYSCLDESLIVESDYSKLNQRIRELIKMDPIEDDRILRYLGFVFDKSIEMNTSLLWGNYNNYPEEEKNKLISELTEQMDALVHS